MQNHIHFGEIDGDFTCDNPEWITFKNCVFSQVRPLVGQERVHNVPQCVHFIPDKPQLILGKDRGFTFDYVFPPKTTQVRTLSAC